MSTARKLPIASNDPTARRPFKHREYGTLAMPVHKSDMSMLMGEFACTKQFQLEKQREAAGIGRELHNGKSAMGTAAHETIRRALSVTELRERILAGDASIAVTRVRQVLMEEFAKETQGKNVAWFGKAEEQSVLDHLTEMLEGLFANIHKHVAAVEMVEAGFISKVGEIWTEGHQDLIYRPRENQEALALTDWKTGAQKPHQITLDHGFESGFYSAALQSGLFVPTTAVADWQKHARDDRTELVPLDAWDVPALVHAKDAREAMHVVLRSLARKRERGEPMPEEVRVFGKFPEIIRLTHLADYEVYKKKGKKKVERPEEVAHWGLTEPGDIQYEAGLRKGPAWYHVKRTPEDVQRLEKRLKTVVGWVRFGLFVDAVGEKCTRCSFRGPCLTSGYEARGDAAKELADDLAGLTFTGIADNDQ